MGADREPARAKKPPCRPYTESALHRAPEPTEDPPLQIAAGNPEQLRALTRICTDDLLEAFGLCRRWTEVPGRRESSLRRISTRAVEPLCRLPAARLARQVAFYDGIVGERGLRAGGAWAVQRLSRSLAVSGAGSIPAEGPVLVVSSHPGLADSLSLFAAIPREDLRVIAAERAFLRALPNTSRYLLPVDTSLGGGPGGLRKASRHLKRGGALLTFPKGGIEPDPASVPGAEASLESWSRSLSLFARLTPEAKVIPAIVSGVISPSALVNPVTRLRRRPEDQRWLAASLQMLVPTLRDVHTEVRFGRPVSPSVNGGEDTARTSEEVLREARRMIRETGLDQENV